MMVLTDRRIHYLLRSKQSARKIRNGEIFNDSEPALQFPQYRKWPGRLYRRIGRIIFVYVGYLHRAASPLADPRENRMSSWRHTDRGPYMLYIPSILKPRSARNEITSELFGAPW